MRCWWEGSYHTGASSRLGLQGGCLLGQGKMFGGGTALSIASTGLPEDPPVPSAQPAWLYCASSYVSNLVMKSPLVNSALLRACLLSGCVAHSAQAE